MLISDLSHLEVIAQETSIIGGGGDVCYPSRGINFDVYVDVDKCINIGEKVHIDKDLYVKSIVCGNSALAQADASASGCDTSAQGFSFTYTTDYSSSSTAMSMSQSN
jgi:hypothetical protein